MSNPVYTRRPAETLGSDALAELALDLRWSFNHAADAVWQRLDPALWDLTHNPWFVLQSVSRERLEAVTADGGFQQLVDELVREKRHAHESPTWFQQVHPRAPFSAVAYFSMEFMLSEALPIYSGGLGNVAGDQLKTASNLGVPVERPTVDGRAAISSRGGTSSNGAGVRRDSRPSTSTHTASSTGSACTSTWASSTPTACAWSSTPRDRTAARRFGSH